MRTVSTLIIPLIMLISGSILAQETKLYDFSNFIGTWKYETENEIFILDILNISTHKLVGVWKYENNGKVIYDNTAELNNVDNSEYAIWGAFHFCVLSQNINKRTQEELSITHIDPMNVACEEEGEVMHWTVDSGYSRLKNIPSNPNQLLFHIQPNDPLGGEFFKKDENGILTRQPYYKYDKNVKYFTVPADMILTKVE